MDHEHGQSSARRWGRCARRLCWLAPFAALPLLALAGTAQAQSDAAGRPDLSGWWLWDNPHDGEPSPLADAPFKPGSETAKTIALIKETLKQANLPDLADLGIDQRRENCKPPRFDGFNGGFTEAVEFLLTPGRLTITNEAGLIRRVPLDGSTLPETVEESNAGTSVGRWEGRTLVVETIGTRASGAFIPFGKGAHFTERITLRDADRLEIALHIVAAEVLERPYDKTIAYTRDRGHVFQEYTACVDNDPSFNPKTGRPELDLTPPADLPPPDD
ncbi:MAG: hypothetical protein BGP16_11675 [Sphingobium sp. 66-54]|nr:MAG: hypothetical protein BGP16_11675 [Sphingobium sp. 66-54]